MNKNLPTLQDLGIEELYEDRILVKLENGDQKSKGGIILVAPAGEEKQKIGIVIGIGPGERDENGEKIIRPVRVRRGQRVMFGKYEGSELNFHGEEYYVIRQLGIIARLKPLPEPVIVEEA